MYLPLDCCVAIYNSVGSKARPGPGPYEALIEGLGFNFAKPEPSKAGPELGLLGQAGPGTTLIQMPG